MSAEPQMPRRSRIRPLNGAAPAGDRDRPRLSVRLSRGAAGRWTAVLAGEIDIDCVQEVQRLLAGAARSPAGLDLDLASVTFCDCAGLNLLLRLRECLAAAGGTLRLVAVSRQVLRLLELTNTTESLLRAQPRITDPDRPVEPAAPPPRLSGATSSPSGIPSLVRLGPCEADPAEPTHTPSTTTE